MTAAIQFDGQAFLSTEEIQDVRPNPILAPKSSPLYLTFSDQLPEGTFCWRGPFA